MFVKIFPNVRHSLQKSLENSCTQAAELMLIWPTIPMRWGNLGEQKRHLTQRNALHVEAGFTHL